MYKDKRIVFLAGPIRGVPREKSLAWRVKAIKLLGSDFQLLHALRGREEKETFLDSRAVIARDKDDIKRADIVLVDDTWPNASMIGTAIEVFFAFELGKTIFLFGNAHQGDYWLENHSHGRFATLEKLCAFIKKQFKV